MGSVDSRILPIIRNLPPCRPDEKEFPWMSSERDTSALSARPGSTIWAGPCPSAPPAARTSSTGSPGGSSNAGKKDCPSSPIRISISFTGNRKTWWSLRTTKTTKSCTRSMGKREGKAVSRRSTPWKTMSRRLAKTKADTGRIHPGRKVRGGSLFQAEPSFTIPAASLLRSLKLSTPVKNSRIMATQ